MNDQRYYLLAKLPALGEIGSVPPIGLAELMEHSRESSQEAELVGALILYDDLVQREAFLAGELADVDPAVLNPDVVRNEAALPEYLVSSGAPQDHAVEVDSLWSTYFSYVAEVGRRERSQFLRRWVEFEVGLRNALAGERARRLGLDEAPYLVATELAADDDDHSEILNTWATAQTPLDALQHVIRCRWNWLETHDPWFSFSEDELLVYAARLMLLEQWHRVDDPVKPPDNGEPGLTASRSLPMS